MESSTPSKKPIVVLIHGILRTRWSMWYIGRKLREEGFQPVLFGYKSLKLGIEKQAEELNEFLVKEGLPDSELNFVTHSLGSIIFREFCRKYGGRFKMKRAVMLGPPNQGSTYAAFLRRKVPFLDRFLGPAFVELSDLKIERSALPLELGIIAGGTKTARGVVPLHGEDNDAIVLVRETMLEGAKAHVIIKSWHSLMMYYPAVIKEAVSFLKTGSFFSER